MFVAAENAPLPFGAEAREWLAGATQIAPANLRWTRLRGSTSSSLFVIDDVGGERRFVLRLFDRRHWLREEPDLVAHEVAALREARRTQLLTPELIAACEDAALFGAPVVLMSYLPGRVELRPDGFPLYLNELARTLALLHEHHAENFGWNYVSWVDEANLQIPIWSSQPTLWKAAFEVWRRGAPPFRPVFMHRDFHPVNVLWHRGAISGVVDWVNACRGPALRDVAHCRVNLALMFGNSAAAAFESAYRSRAMDVEPFEPFWDVDAVLDLCLPGPSFYAPWQEFGLNEIAESVLQERAERFLEAVLSHAPA